MFFVKVVIGTLATVIIGLSPMRQVVANAQQSFTITFNGEVVTSDVPPFIEQDRTMVPVRFISEVFGAEVDWDEETRLVTIIVSEREKVKLLIGNHTAIIERNRFFLDDPSDLVYTRIPLGVPAIIREDRTFLPVSSIANVLGIVAEWDAENRIVMLSTLDYLGFVYDDFPEGFYFSEEYQLSRSYGSGLSPREAALRALSVYMFMKQEWLEGWPTPMHVVLVGTYNAGYHFNIYHDDNNWNDRSPDSTVSLFFFMQFIIGFDGGIIRSGGYMAMFPTMFNSIPIADDVEDNDQWVLNEQEWHQFLGDVSWW